jgi:error-prone DNA polymerase
MYPKRLIVDEVRQMGLKVAPLDINESDALYRVEDNGSAVRIALSTITKISDGEVASIIAGRPYIDLTDFVRRSGASAPVTESAILTGAFDRLHTDVNRRDLLLHFSDLQKSPNAGVTGAQMNLAFAPPTLISSGLPDMSPAEIVQHEIARLGIDMSEHLVSFYSDFLNSIGAVRSCDLLAQRSRSSVLVAGIKVAMQTPPVRSGKRVIFVSLDDGYGCSDSTFFSDAQSDYASTLYSSSLLLIRGITRRTGARGISLRATGAWDLRAAYESWRTKESTLAI